MANEQINVPSLVLVLVLSGLLIRYLFFSEPGGGAGAPGQGQRQQRRQGAGPGAQQRDPNRAREAMVERIQQMFPQVDRRTILWDLQRTGGNLTATTERILSGRLETPPISFQPPPPPPSASPPTGSGSSSSTAGGNRPTEKPTEPDLITRYNLQDKVGSPAAADGDASSQGKAAGGKSGSGKAWSSSRDERQALLQRRRDEMILAARRKMEAKIVAEKTAGSDS